MQRKQSNDNSLLLELETITCDNHLQFPYYPVLSTMSYNSIIYLAFKSKDKIVMYTIKNNVLNSQNSIDLSSLTSKSFVTSILFVNPELVQNNQKDQKGTIYLLIGYYNGYLYLVKFSGKNLKIIKKYNRSSQSKSQFLSKTMSLFSTSSSSEYDTWQKTSVIKLKTAKNHVSYLFRNSVLVTFNKLNTTMQDIQKKYQWMMSSKSMAQNIMVQNGNYICFCCQEYCMIKQYQKCIMSFQNTISSYEVTQSSLFVGTYDGMLFQFQRQGYNCLRKISTVVAIKHISNIGNYLVLCLQDDYSQLIDLCVNKYTNLVGHQSFTACALPLGKLIFLASYDRTISITNPFKIQNWKKLQSKNNIQSSYQINPFSVKVDQKSQLKTQAGIGTGVICDNILILSTFDNKIKIFKVNESFLNK